MFQGGGGEHFLFSFWGVDIVFYVTSILWNWFHHAIGSGVLLSLLLFVIVIDKLENNKIEVLFSLVKQGILRKPLFGLVRKENLQQQRVLKTLMPPTGTACIHVLFFCTAQIFCRFRSCTIIQYMHLIPKWRPINYSFVCKLISHLCLIFASKFFCVLYMLQAKRAN